MQFQLQSLLLVVQVILAISLIALILLQQGRGAQAGAAFGSGASSTVFGARGAVPFLVKITTVLAIIFFINSLGLAYLSAKQPEQQSLIDRLQKIEASKKATEKAAEKAAAKPKLEPTAGDAADTAPANELDKAPEPPAEDSGSAEENKAPADLPPTK